MRRTIGWVTPHSPAEVRQFVTKQASPASSMLQALVDSQSVDPLDLQSRMDKIINSPTHPLDEKTFQSARRDVAGTGYYLPGSEVKLAVDRNNGNPFSGETKTIEEIMLSAADNAHYRTRYRLEGEQEWHDRGKMIDARGTQHGYGVITESAGRIYYVELEKADQRYEDNELKVREIVGVEKEQQHRILRAIKDHDLDADQAPSDMRQVLNVGKGQGETSISGEFSYHAMKGPQDLTGPIILEATSWMSTPDRDEADRTNAIINKHVEKYEFGISDKTPDRPKSLSALHESNLQKSMYDRSNAHAQAMASQGIF